MASDQEITLIAATPDWLALAKPAGWLTIPGRNSDAPVLSRWAEERHGRIWIVHRIDRETSGVVLFARSAEAHQRANGWFQAHQVKKAYDCLAQGDPGSPVFKLKSPVEGVASTTQAEVREKFAAAGAFLARAIPVTGRRHQIRVHFSHAGFPLLGDPEYGGSRELGGLAVERVALHAARLELPSGEVFAAEWPADFREWVGKLRARAS